MDLFFMLIIFLAGAVIGAVAGFMISRVQVGAASKSRELLQKQLNEITLEDRLHQQQLNDKGQAAIQLEKELTERRHDLMLLSANLAARDTQIDYLNQKLSENKAELEKIYIKFSDEFKNLSNEILARESRHFTETNKANMELLLKPLGERIRDFEKKIEEVYDKESQQRFSLKEEVTRLGELNKQMSLEAQNLTQALKGQAKTQGGWGEMILATLLEKSGLVKGREFEMQKSFADEAGSRLQPDVVLHLPDDKTVVIDAKVSLTAYERYANCQQEMMQIAELKDHLTSVKKHIDELAAKNYQHIYQINSLDFVLLFMPIEPAYMLAMHHDGGLWNYAFSKGVLLAGPSNLIAILKMTAALWQKEYQNRNVLAIAAESGKLYDKFVAFVADLDDVGDKLKAAQNCYHKAYNKLSTGKGNLVIRAEKIKALGARTTRQLPKNILEQNAITSAPNDDEEPDNGDLEKNQTEVLVSELNRGMATKELPSTIEEES
ncbi:MAG: DNA recombination protein RmuC [Clostridia bacterium]|nr:DNA recombination protein RmuC [Clostridia bacterium]